MKVLFWLIILLSPALLEAKTEIRGGDSYETAVPLDFNKEYKLDHHQKLGYFDYFYVDLKPGQELAIELKTLEKGVNLRGQNPREGGLPYAGVQIHDNKRNKLKSDNIIGTAHASKIVSYTPAAAGRYYVLVGSTYDAMNKDHVTFTLTSEFKGDLDSKQDAGTSMSEAMPMQALRYQKNFIGSGDTKDVFAFQARSGDEYFIGIIPQDDSGSYFKLAVFDSYKQQVLSKSSGINQGLKTKTFKVPDDGTYYLQITLGTSVSRPIHYLLELKRVTGIAPSAGMQQPPPAATPKRPPPGHGPGPQARPSTSPLP